MSKISCLFLVVAVVGVIQIQANPRPNSLSEPLDVVDGQEDTITDADESFLDDINSPLGRVVRKALLDADGQTPGLNGTPDEHRETVSGIVDSGTGVVQNVLVGVTSALGDIVKGALQKFISKEGAFQRLIKKVIGKKKNSEVSKS